MVEAGTHQFLYAGPLCNIISQGSPPFSCEKMLQSSDLLALVGSFHHESDVDPPTRLDLPHQTVD